MDLYNAEGKLRRLLGELGGVNAGYIRGFAAALRAEGVSAGRVYKYAVSLAKISSVMDGKDFVLWSRGDVERFCVWLESQPFST
ncbi:MAG: hypothetical protein QW707_05110 [Candidatus Bathyarchaeia archaeon]